MKCDTKQPQCIKTETVSHQHVRGKSVSKLQRVLKFDNMLQFMITRECILLYADRTAWCCSSPSDVPASPAHQTNKQSVYEGSARVTH